MVLLIGVSHTEENLDLVLRRLDFEDISGKKVMIETFSYPLEDEIRKRYPSFTYFWDGISKCVLDNKGKIVFGEDKALYYNALEKMAERNDQIKGLRRELDKMYQLIENGLPRGREGREKRSREGRKQIEDQIAKLFYKMDSEDPFVERDPHFAEVTIKEKPDIVILGYDHIPYLVKNCFPDNNYSVSFVPKKDFKVF